MHKQAAIDKKIPDFAARLSDQQASMAGGTVRRAITAPVVRFMVGADRIIGANPQALQSAPKDMRKSRGRGD